MIGVMHTNIKKIPSLVVVSLNKKDHPLPTIIYSHGFTSAKEHNLPIAFLLAEAGYRVVLPDSEFHGEREGNISSAERQVAFWDIIIKNIEELEIIKNYFSEKKLILNGQIGVAGTSMGGITTASALTQYDWIKASAILMGSPMMYEYAKISVESFQGSGVLPVTEKELEELYQKLRQMDLSLHPQTLNERPILLWHGEADKVVPAEHVKTFYKTVKPLFKNKDHIRLLLEANRTHKVSRYAILETVKWFREHLLF